MNKEQLDSLLDWSPAKRVQTRNGLRYLRTADPTPQFWDRWENEHERQGMKALGVSVGRKWKNESQFEVCWWQTPTKEEVEKLNANIAASQLAASNAIIAKPDNGLDYFPFQKAGIVYARGKGGILIGDEMGLGKGHPHGTLIPMGVGGFCPVEKLAVGDVVLGSTMQPVEVTGVFDKPTQKIYRIHFWDGSHVDCDGDHLWVVRDYNGRRREALHGHPWMTVETRRLAKMKLMSQGKPRFHLPLPFVTKDNFGSDMVRALPMDPYVMGCIIANGYYDKKASSVVVTVNSEDKQVIARLSNGESVREAQGCVAIVVKEAMVKMKDLGMRATGAGKCIPTVYMEAPFRERMALLHGLMDCDGSCQLNRTVYHTVSLSLAGQVKELVASLGGISKVRAYDRTHEGKPVEYQINIKTLFCPFLLCERKCNRWHSPDLAHEPKRTITGIEELPDRQRTVCISVDAKDKLYLVGPDYVVTHNTIQAIGIINDRPNIGCGLVVCPASVKRNWYREIQTWLNRKLWVEIAQAKCWPTMADLIILNYDILGKHADALASREWDIVIADECHMLRNMQTSRWRAFSKIACKMRVGLTGTPLMNKLEDIYPILHWIDSDQFRSINSFRYKFVDDPDGRAKLQTRLREGFMVRRLKADVMKELPKVRRQVIEVEDTVGAVEAEEAAMSGIDINHDLIADLVAAVEVARISENTEEYEAALSELQKCQRIPFDSMARVRHETSLRKVPLTIEHIGSCMESGIGKIVVFGHHRDCLEAIVAAFPGSALYYGGMSEMAKDAAIRRFMEDPKCQVWAGSIRAGGMGINGLQTVCSHAVIHELDWVPAMISQAEARLDRIGQKSSVLVQHLVIAGSIDANMARKCVDKQRMADEALDKDRDKLVSEVVVPDPKPRHGTPVNSVALTAREMEEGTIDPAQRVAAHRGLRLIAGLCDGARQLDANGFNKVDAYIGKRLACLPSLSTKQGILAKKLCRKYRRQIANTEPQILETLGIV